MGHKISAESFRVGITKDWKSLWFDDKDYAKYALEDFKIRQFLEKKLKIAGLDTVNIERSKAKLKVIVYVSRPGMVIGRGGSGVEALQKELKSQVSGQIDLEVREPEKGHFSATLLADKVARQIERRRHPKKVTNAAADEVMARGAKGVKILISGRIRGAEIARREQVVRGLIPLQSLRANISFAKDTAHTKYGTIGVKVWVYMGEFS